MFLIALVFFIVSYETSTFIEGTIEVLDKEFSPGYAVKAFEGFSAGCQIFMILS